MTDVIKSDVSNNGVLKWNFRLDGPEFVGIIGFERYKIGHGWEICIYADGDITSSIFRNL